MTQKEQILLYISKTLSAIPLQRRNARFHQQAFGNPENKKCFAVVKSVFNDVSHAPKEMVTFRCDPLLSGSLRLQEGFVAAHTDGWISVLLDGSVPTETVCSLLAMAQDLTAGQRIASTREWLIPANPKYFDLITAFSENEVIYWKQGSNISVGDIVYLYVTAPYSAILYRCKAVEVDIPRINTRRNSTKAMRIQKLHTYDKSEFSLAVLKEFGAATVRGPRSIPPALRHALESAATKGKDG